MFLFIALNQVVLCSLFPVQQTTSGIGHRVKYLVVFFGLATKRLNVRSNNSNNKPMCHKKCYASFHGAQGVLLYHISLNRKQTQSSP